VTDNQLQVVDADDEIDEPVTEGAAPPARKRSSAFAWVRRHLVAIALAVVLIAVLAVTGWLYVTQYRPDQQTDAAAADTAIKAASDGTVALLSYAPDSLDSDFASAKSHLTGDFLNYYTTFTTDVVKPAATQKSVKTTASVTQSALSEIHPDSAQVLLFINQTTTSQENPNGAFAASSVKVGLTKVNGNWLISSFDPV
jgi:Mce-associated membrane protein